MRKIIYSIFLYFTFIFLNSTPCSATDDELFVVTETWPPFRIVDEDNEFNYTGIDLDLLKKISERLNVTLIVKRYPWARCLLMMKKGQADIITGLAYTEERSQYISYSQIPYHSVSPAFYLKKGKGHMINQYEDLYQFSIGYSLKSAYFEPFDSDANLKKHGVSKEIQLINMLINNRLDTIIGSDSNIEYDIAQMGLKE